ncbi:MAG TPA: hypothetical protein VHM20_02255 [Gammaproteobacteria bacterium]|jgi:hypothetical protein|nr:hypothetical protein [Gammaproteobacteria bacterium]
MKQTIAVNVTVPSSGYALGFNGVYLAEDKLIAVCQATPPKGFALQVISDIDAIVTVDVPNKTGPLPVEIYYIGHNLSDNPNIKDVTLLDSNKIIKNLKPLSFISNNNHSFAHSELQNIDRKISGMKK